MKALFEHAISQEVILEEVFLSDDNNEERPMNVYSDDLLSNPGIMYAVDFNTEKVRTFRLTANQDDIAEEHREKILNYRLNNPTSDDDVYLGDIFMQGDHIKEIE